MLVARVGRLDQQRRRPLLEDQVEDLRQLGVVMMGGLVVAPAGEKTWEAG
jgi:hypothetical protein